MAERRINFIIRICVYDVATMKDEPEIAKSVPDKVGLGPVSVPYDDVELTPKEEAVVANHLPPEEQLVKIEKKLEHEAAEANQLPRTQQLKKFETKLEHDDPGNQPS